MSFWFPRATRPLRLTSRCISTEPSFALQPKPQIWIRSCSTLILIHGATRTDRPASRILEGDRVGSGTPKRSLNRRSACRSTTVANRPNVAARSSFTETAVRILLDAKAPNACRSHHAIPDPISRRPTTNEKGCYRTSFSRRRCLDQRDRFGRFLMTALR